ncbi:hypothetical protein GE09DRAFT_18364 [Coniochaeta sp. 2T2.1]|nr:hypothetical protein GE09DRAFT_18364 [Coniochaeta sp. 2T2.1]
MADSTSWQGCTLCRDLDRMCPASLPQSHAYFLTLSSEDASDDSQMLVLSSRSLAAFKSSAAEGCGKCAAIVQTLLFYRPKMEPSHVVNVYLAPSANPVIKFLGGVSNNVQFYTPHGLKPAWPGLCALPDIGSSPQSNQAIAFIKECVRVCLQEHNGCAATGRVLPTRLIDVGASGESRVN